MTVVDGWLALRWMNPLAGGPPAAALLAYYI